MTSTIVAAALALDALRIHHAVCRARKQQLVCSTCAELAERATRYAARVKVAAHSTRWRSLRAS